MRGERTLGATKTDWSDDPAADVRRALGALDARGAGAVGHRVVHGGTRFTRATEIDDAMLAELAALGSLAPLHLPLAERSIAAARALLPDVPHVAVFDTSFHRTLEPAAYTYALPYGWLERYGVRRFGFHGLSVEWSLERAGALLRRAPRELGLVVAHLGSGCSVTAVWEGRSVDTSMGMTPLEGLVMGTRAGSVDPGILTFLLREKHLDVGALDDALEHRSGLLGLAGTADMRALLGRGASRDDRAALAVELFARRAAAGIAAVATALPRLDAIAFTGGIGENAGGVRARIVARLGTLGVAPIAEADARADGALSAPGARVAVLRIEAREDLVVARHVARALAPEAAR